VTEIQRDAIVRGAVSPALCSAWLELIDEAHRRLAGDHSPDFVPESSSFRLRAVAEPSATDVWAALSDGARDRCRALVGETIVIDADECWVRRQYPFGSMPSRHHSHAWHQDGALRFDFAAHRDNPTPDEALLPMATCWLTLTPCGVDAPGLELVTDRVDELLRPGQLSEAAVDRNHPATTRTQPTLAAGDALVFSGDVLHRTHITHAMTATRTSVELRCFPMTAIPHRLRGDEFVAAPLSATT